MEGSIGLLPGPSHGSTFELMLGETPSGDEMGFHLNVDGTVSQSASKYGLPPQRGWDCKSVSK